jgi:hypothetical protein
MAPHDVVNVDVEQQLIDAYDECMKRLEVVWLYIF